MRSNLIQAFQAMFSQLPLVSYRQTTWKLWTYAHDFISFSPYSNTRCFIYACIYFHHLWVLYELTA